MLHAASRNEQKLRQAALPQSAVLTIVSVKSAGRLWAWGLPGEAGVSSL